MRQFAACAVWPPCWAHTGATGCTGASPLFSFEKAATTLVDRSWNRLAEDTSTFYHSVLGQRFVQLCVVVRMQDGGWGSKVMHIVDTLGGPRLRLGCRRK